MLEQLYPSYEHFRQLGRFRRLLTFGAKPRVLAAAGMTIVGSPAECIARLGRLKEAGVTHLLCAVGAGALPTETVRESLEAIAEEVMPATAGRAQARHDQTVGSHCCCAAPNEPTTGVGGGSPACAEPERNASGDACRCLTIGRPADRARASASP